MNTDDRREAQKRLADLYNQVERGEYQQAKETFEDRAKQYNPVSLKGIYKGQPSKDKQRTLDYHLLPHFKGKTVVQVEEASSFSGLAIKISCGHFDLFYARGVTNKLPLATRHLLHHHFLLLTL